MRDRFTSTPPLHHDTFMRPLLFSVNELRMILSAYSDGVMKKGWRDYAIQSAHGQSLFCVVDRGGDGPDSQGVVLFSLSKNRSARAGGKPFWRLFERDRQILRTESALDAIAAFAACGMPGDPSGKRRR